MAEGKHAKHAAPEAMEELVAEERAGKLKIAGIVAASVIGGICVIYLIGALFFSRFFLPNTKLNGRDVSLTSCWSLEDSIYYDSRDYSLAVTGDGLDFTIDASNVDLYVDAEEIAEDVMGQQNPWRWPLELMQSHELSYEPEAQFDDAKLLAYVEPYVSAANGTVVESQNAYVTFDTDAWQFKIVPEVYGSALNAQQIADAAGRAIFNMESQLVLDEQFQASPSVLSDDERLVAQLGTANGIINSTIDLTLAGTTFTTVYGAQFADLVTLAPEGFAVNFDDETFRTWALEEFASKYDTTNDDVSYTRADGKEISVPGGRSTYGWVLDSAELTEQLLGYIKAGYVGSLEAPCKQTADYFGGRGSRSWGYRYVDVDLSEQYVRYYDAEGNLAWESSCVSGDASIGHGTPEGVFFIQDKEVNTTLVSRDIDPVTQKPEYESPVDRWMPFLSYSWGLHDASWRYEFGGNIYYGYGSHGCVNLPVEAAHELYDLIDIGTPVVVHS